MDVEVHPYNTEYLPPSPPKPPQNKTQNAPTATTPDSNPNPNPPDTGTEITTTWQSLMDTGRNRLVCRRLEFALQSFTSALHLCDDPSTPPDSPLATPAYRYRVLGDLGWVNRLSGRYEVALGWLEEAVRVMEQGDGLERTRPGVFIKGEVGAVLRLMGRGGEARGVFEEMWETAKEMEMEGAMCRAAGHLGAVNYQFGMEAWEKGEKDEAERLVRLAMGQLEECVRLAKRVKREEGPKGGSHTSTTRYREAEAWVALGYGRLSLCYTALAVFDGGDNQELIGKAAELAREGVGRAECGRNDSVIPMCELFYGRVLLMQGKKELALEQFNPDRSCGWKGISVTPAMALCKEPSAEHRGFLREVIDAGADLSMADLEGYTALDHAVFSGDAEAERMVLEGLKKQLNLSDSDAAGLQTESYLRKGYRQILQEKLRPILYRGGEDPDCTKKVRRVYAETLAADAEKSRLFDHLKFIRFTDFKKFGRLPRSSDGLVRSFELKQSGEDDNGLDFLIFFSYRWINQDKSLNTPDDANHTQYRRMLDAIDLFVQQNPSVKAEKLCIWMDFACVDQDNPNAGVSALPIIITQCDAVISLVDDTYYERAWCCVEALMISHLDYSSRRSSAHHWYEHMPPSTAEQSGEEMENKGEWTLVKARKHRLDMQDKKLTYETDRDKVMFLARQARLLWRVSY